MLALLLLSIVPVEDVVEQTVDVIECSTTFGDEGTRVILDQFIFREWDGQVSYFEILDWKLACPAGQCPPSPDKEDGMYVLLFEDSRGTMRLVRSPLLRVTGLDHDTEIRERRWLPEQQRKRLRPGRAEIRALINQ